MPIAPRRRAEGGEASDCHPGPAALWRLLGGTVCGGLRKRTFHIEIATLWIKELTQWFCIGLPSCSGNHRDGLNMGKIKAAEAGVH